jgi:ABC-type transport system substrate-binding protein
MRRGIGGDKEMAQNGTLVPLRRRAAWTLRSALVRRLSPVLAVVAAASLTGVIAPPADAQNVLRVVMHSHLKIVDPIWTTAYITRNHGYMIYDTLFATDAKGEIHPQMLDKYDVSADKLTYTMTLRDGLLWHDGKPVTAEDCVASIKRWAAKDSMGQKLMTFVKEVTAVNPKTELDGALHDERACQRGASLWQTDVFARQ